MASYDHGHGRCMIIGLSTRHQLECAVPHSDAPRQRAPGPACLLRPPGATLQSAVAAAGQPGFKFAGPPHNWTVTLLGGCRENGCVVYDGILMWPLACAQRRQDVGSEFGSRRITNRCALRNMYIWRNGLKQNNCSGKKIRIFSRISTFSTQHPSLRADERNQCS